ncbi:SRPBCC domain-containing protein [Pedobacter heparinus]|uniref:SRPBCC domain-containing protein n=1 Tax=Pedobacter heparinus TaxID=984 RepID=UPI00292ECD06|nr:SRPBCC domain-containing protein [Pedobacter heparinus]
MDMLQKTILINVPAPVVWDTLTLIPYVQEWTYDIPIQIQTDWKVGSAIVTSGDLHGIPFRNSGTILSFDPNVKLSYSFLSSLSNLPDTDENHCLLEFYLAYENKQTRLDLFISNFPDYVIRKHLELHWGPTLDLIKQQTESRHR